jgi:alkylation response protein AidB-like acyl-CoA dehydrogenase
MAAAQFGDDRSATLEAFESSAQEILAAVDHRARRRSLASADHSFDMGMWKSLAEAGWLSVLVPEAEGGLGLGVDVAAVLARAAGTHLLPEPFVAGAAMSTLVLRQCPDSECRSMLLRAISDGSILVASAWQEDIGQVEADPRAVLADATDGTSSLTGTKRFVDPGDGAAGWLVLARRGTEPVLAWVSADAPGVTLATQRRVDGGCWATVTFERTPVRAQYVLAEGAPALAAVQESIHDSRLLQSAELVGVARRALDLTLEYVRVRSQFGRPIGSFQSLQHRLVDAALQVELATASLEEALASSEPLHRRAYSARTKARAAAAALDVTRLAIQLHGAIGITRDCDIGHYLTRAISLNAALGPSRELRLRWSEETRRAPAEQEDAVALPEVADTTDWNELTDAQFRRVVREFFKANYPEQSRHEPLQYVHAHQIQDWNRILYERGWRAPAWPKEYGGMGLSPAKLIALHDEKERYGVARWTDQGCELLGPLLIRFGTIDQRRRYLPKILSGEHVWCQGYSEPNAGSDLASLKMTAELDGDHFVVNGRKIWTSYAHEATHVFLLVRTERTTKPSAGISFLLAEMNRPGIACRTIPDLTGDESFCEITFDDVRLPRENLVGELHQGWALAKSLLGHERLIIGNPGPVNFVLEQLRVLGEERRLFDAASFCERYAEIALDVADLNSLYTRFADVLRRGEKVPPHVSMLKIFCTETWQRASAVLSEAAEESGACLGAQPVGARALHLLMPTFNSLPGSIYGGSNEIQRNILARQVLGLPD